MNKKSFELFSLTLLSIFCLLSCFAVGDIKKPAKVVNEGLAISPELFQKTEPKLTIKLYYPVLSGINKPSIQKCNEIFQLAFLDDAKRIDKDDEFSQEYSADYSVKMIKWPVLSIVNNSYFYAEGAAHGIPSVVGVTLNLETGKALKFSDFLKPEALNELSKKLINEINKRFSADFGPTEFEKLNPDQTFYITEKALVIVFNPYEVGPYAIGIPEFQFLWKDLREFLIDKCFPIYKPASQNAVF